MRTLLPLLLSVPLTAQGNLYFSPVFDPAEIAPGLETIRPIDLKSHVTFLASTALGGRGTGQPGIEAAAEYIAAQFRRLELEPLGPGGSYFQTYELIKARLKGEPSLSVSRREGEGSFREAFDYGDDFYVSTRGLASSLELEAAVVFGGYGIEAEEYLYHDYRDVSAAGKVVLVIDGEPEGDLFKGKEETRYADVREKVKTAREKGAAALVVASNPAEGEIFSEKFRRWKSWLSHEAMMLPTSERPMPLVFISQRTADRILAGSGSTLASLAAALKAAPPTAVPQTHGRVALSIQVEKESVVARNVAGLLKGSDPSVAEETIVVSAHYDHLGTDAEGAIHPGADDNGSGTSAVLELAEALARNPARPRRNILFLLVSGEERGLLGSEFYTTQPLIPLGNTITNLNIDMIGRNAPDSVYVIGTNMLSDDLHATVEFAVGKAEGMHLNYRYNSKDDPERFYYRSDHYNFAKRDIPVTFFFAGVHGDYHKPTDTADKLDYEKMARVTKLVGLTAWGVAQNILRPRLKGKEQISLLPEKIKK